MTSEVINKTQPDCINPLEVIWNSRPCTCRHSQRTSKQVKVSVHAAPTSSPTCMTGHKGYSEPQHCHAPTRQKRRSQVHYSTRKTGDLQAIVRLPMLRQDWTRTTVHPTADVQKSLEKRPSAFAYKFEKLRKTW